MAMPARVFFAYSIAARHQTLKTLIRTIETAHESYTQIKGPPGKTKTVCKALACSISTTTPLFRTNLTPLLTEADGPVASARSPVR